MDNVPSRAAVLVLLAASAPLLAFAQQQPGSTAAAADAARPDATDFRLSPKNGQDAEQEWFDRYGCDGWARRQSGYDPIDKEAGPSQQAASEEYRRLITTCLEQHGYEVHYAPPQPPAPTPYEWTTERRTVPPELLYRSLSVQAGGGYSVTAGSTRDYLQDGANAGAALTWFPGAVSPLGVRVEGSYTWSRPASQLLALNGVGYNRGQVEIYGGDVDLRLNLSHLPTRHQLYLVAGVGWYRIESILQKVSQVRVCGLHSCDVFQTVLAEQHDRLPWAWSWNAGFGWEIALDSHTAFFVEARYRHTGSCCGGVQLVPVWLGLRF